MERHFLRVKYPKCEGAMVLAFAMDFVFRGRVLPI